MIRLMMFGLTLVLVSGCSQQSAEQSGIAPAVVTPVAFNSGSAPTVQFTVPDMMCPEGCGAKVKEILSQQPGAKDVLVDFDSKTATVAVDKDKFDSKQAIAALVDHQFSHAALKDAGGAAAAPAAIQ